MNIWEEIRKLDSQRAAGVIDPHRPRSGHLPPWGEEGRGVAAVRA